MLSTAFTSLLAHKLRMFAVATAVLLGVAFMAGTMVLTDTVTRTFDDLFGDVYKNTDVVVRGDPVFEGPVALGVQRGRVDEGLVAEVARVPGVAEARGSVFGYARLIGKDGKALGHPATGAPALGGDWTPSATLNPFTLVEGREPVAANDIIIDRKSAKDGDLAVGDETTVLVQGPPLKVRVSGVAMFGSVDSPGGATVVLFRTDVAQRVIAEPGKYDTIVLAADPGVSQEQLRDRVAAVLPEEAEAVTGVAVTKETQDAIGDAFAFFNTFMLVFAIVALLVGGFMIFNTFSITVAQRTRENGLLRALGATRRQVLLSVIVEAVVVGVVASFVGLGLGVVVAIGLKELLAAVGIPIPATGVVFTTQTAAISLSVGILVTLAAAVSPARKAGKVPPIAAMQQGTATSVGYGSKQRVLVGSGLVVLGAAVLLTGLYASLDNGVAIVGLGALLVFFGVAALGRTVALPLSRWIGAPLPRLRGVTGDLARENAMRNPRRTAATASALMIGVGLVGFISIFVSSAKASLADTMDRAFTGDLVVNSGAGMTGGVDPSFAQRLGTLPEVEAATGLRQGLASIEGSVEFLLAVAPDTAFEIFDVKPLSGAPSDLDRTSIALYKDAAERLDVQVGDTVPVLFRDTGLQQMRVAMVYGENQPAQDFLLSMDGYKANFADQYDAMVFIKRAPDVTAAQALAAVERVARDYPGLDVLDREGFTAEQSRPLNQMLALVYALLALAVLIALLGISNTLALSVFERTREIGLLRAVGMTRSQLRSAIRWESVIIALQGTVLGLLIGVFFGWALVSASEDLGITVFALPYLDLAAIVVLAAGAGMVAAVAPGHRAAKLDVLRAVVTE